MNFDEATILSWEGISVKIVRSIAMVGGFLFAALFSIMALGICNPAAYHLDFQFSGVHAIAVSSIYGLWQYPVFTLVTAGIAGIAGAWTIRKLFQKRHSLIAWYMGGAGYCLLFMMAFFLWSIYQILSGAGGYD